MEPIVISCSAQAYPNVRLTWTHNNRVISTDEKYQITQDPSDEVTTANSTLTIRDISSSDNGVVSCVAETDGCDVTLSKNSCHRIVLTNRTDTTLNIYSTFVPNVLSVYLLWVRESLNAWTNFSRHFN